jgi:hypothetical protein
VDEHAYADGGHFDIEPAADPLREPGIAPIEIPEGLSQTLHDPGLGFSEGSVGRELRLAYDQILQHGATLLGNHPRQTRSDRFRVLKNRFRGPTSPPALDRRGVVGMTCGSIHQF